MAQVTAYALLDGLAARGRSRAVAKAGSLWFNVGAQDHLQTTWLLVKVLYPVEQPPYCDLLRLCLRSGDLFFIS